MGTHIEAVWAQGGTGRRRATARGLADAAARHCLALAGCAPGDVDMLINVGMYREDSLGEPALAALIQQDIGATPSRRPGWPAGQAGTFSFDLLNGACGALTAIQIESGLLTSGVIRLGAVVSSDVQPDVKEPRAAFLRPAGGALLLRWRDGDAGFTDLARRRFPSTRTCSPAVSCGGDGTASPFPGRAAGATRWSSRCGPATMPGWPTAPRRPRAASCAG